MNRDATPDATRTERMSVVTMRASDERLRL